MIEDDLQALRLAALDEAIKRGIADSDADRVEDADVVQARLNANYRNQKSPKS